MRLMKWTFADMKENMRAILHERDAIIMFTNLYGGAFIQWDGIFQEATLLSEDFAQAIAIEGEDVCHFKWYKRGKEGVQKLVAMKKGTSVTVRGALLGIDRGGNEVILLEGEMLVDGKDPRDLKPEQLYVSVPLPEKQLKFMDMNITCSDFKLRPKTEVIENPYLKEIPIWSVKLAAFDKEGKPVEWSYGTRIRLQLFTKKPNSLTSPQFDSLIFDRLYLVDAIYEEFSCTIPATLLDSKYLTALPDCYVGVIVTQPQVGNIYRTLLTQKPLSFPKPSK